MQEFLKIFSVRDILLHMLNVAVLFLAIRWWLYKPIRAFMDERAGRVATEFADAEVKQKAADERLAQLGEEARQARLDASEAIAGGVEQGQKAAGEILERARAQAQAIVEQGRGEAEHLRLEAAEGVRAQAVNMAVEIAGKLLEREVKREDHQKIIGEFLTKGGGN